LRLISQLRGHVHAERIVAVGNLIESDNPVSHNAETSLFLHCFSESRRSASFNDLDKGKSGYAGLRMTGFGVIRRSG
jgi:hypothetical protein